MALECLLESYKNRFQWINGVAQYEIYENARCAEQKIDN